MKGIKRIVGTSLAAAMVFSASGTGAKGPQFRESVTVRGITSGVSGDHHLTFSGPVGLPGISLGAGTYIFRRPAANVLQVLSEHRQPYAMVITTPTMRPTPADTYEIVLGAPGAPGAPKRIEAWFLPGESTGQQLSYRNR